MVTHLNGERRKMVVCGGGNHLHSHILLVVTYFTYFGGLSTRLDLGLRHQITSFQTGRSGTNSDYFDSFSCFRSFGASIVLAINWTVHCTDTLWAVFISRIAHFPNILFTGPRTLYISRRSAIGIGKYHNFPIAMILTHAFRFFNIEVNSP